MPKHAGANTDAANDLIMLMGGMTQTGRNKINACFAKVNAMAAEIALLKKRIIPVQQQQGVIVVATNVQGVRGKGTLRGDSFTIGG